MNETMGIKGKLTIELIRNKKVVETQTVDNSLYAIHVNKTKTMDCMKRVLAESQTYL